MSDEPTTQDVEALAELLHGDIAWEDCVDGDWVHSHVGLTGFQARRLLTSDWYAGRIAQARREGAAEAWDEGWKAAQRSRYTAPFPGENPHRDDA